VPRAQAVRGTTEHGAPALRRSLSSLKSRTRIPVWRARHRFDSNVREDARRIERAAQDIAESLSHITGAVGQRNLRRSDWRWRLRSAMSALDPFRSLDQRHKFNPARDSQAPVFPRIFHSFLRRGRFFRHAFRNYPGVGSFLPRASNPSGREAWNPGSFGCRGFLLWAFRP
jgi:hypothetical protein